MSPQDASEDGQQSWTVKEFAAELARFKRDCGDPSLRRLETLSKETKRLPRSTIGDALGGERLPPIAVVLQIVQLCLRAAHEDRLKIQGNRLDGSWWHQRWSETQLLNRLSAFSGPPAHRLAPQQAANYSATSLIEEVGPTTDSATANLGFWVKEKATWMLLGQQLRNLRINADTTLTETARRLEISEDHLSILEAGKACAGRRVVAFYETYFHGAGLAWGLYEDALATSRPSQRQIDGPAPQYPIFGDASEFVADVTVPDGTMMPPLQKFDKIWRIRNSGSVPWKGRWLARRGAVTGLGLPTSPERVPIPDTLPGQEVELTVPMTSQPLAGSSQAHFKMVDDHGWEYLPQPQYLVGVVVTIVVAYDAPGF